MDVAGCYENADGVSMKKRARSASVVFALFMPALLLGLAGGCNGCHKDDDDKPAPSAAPPPPAPTPSAPATVMPEEDAGTPPADAGADAAHPVGPGGPPGSGTLAKCCAALQQNANSAPIDQKMYYMAAAQYCNGVRNTPAGQQAFAQIRSFLAGAKMPGACR
jgi:hypothetical protein